MPVYDQNTGDEVGTQSRGRAIATNPLTIIGMGAAALAGAELLLPEAAGAVVEELTPFAQRYLSVTGRRLGSTITRRQLYEIAQEYDQSGQYVELQGDGKASEEYIPGPRPGTKGGTFADFTATSADGTTTRLQTINILRDGVTPTKDEAAAAARIKAAFPNDKLILIRRGNMKYVFFFASPSDIIPVLRRFEENSPLKFVDPETKPTPNRAIYLSSCEIPSPGISTSESGNGSKTYIVSHRDTKNIMHTFVDKSGRRRWTINNGDNDGSVMLTLAGVWTTGTMLPGHMSTLHRTAVAQQLMRWFLSALQSEHFTKLDLWWLGPQALEMLRAGKRLSTTAEQSPTEFDLKLPGAN